jgi:hypothetical protein
MTPEVPLALYAHSNIYHRARALVSGSVHSNGSRQARKTCTTYSQAQYISSVSIEYLLIFASQVLPLYTPSKNPINDVPRALYAACSIKVHGEKSHAVPANQHPYIVNRPVREKYPSRHRRYKNTRAAIYTQKFRPMPSQKIDAPSRCKVRRTHGASGTRIVTSKETTSNLVCSIAKRPGVGSRK